MQKVSLALCRVSRNAYPTPKSTSLAGDLDSILPLFRWLEGLDKHFAKPGRPVSIRSVGLIIAGHTSRASPFPSLLPQGGAS